MIETHCSRVFLTGACVYKVKKPVNFGFLDYSTLARRKHLCERELELNRRFCPRTYLEVVPIFQKAGKLSFSPAGNPVEYALKMRQLSSDGFLKNLIEQNQVAEKDLDRVVSVLASVYQHQQPSSQTTRWGHPENLQISTDENFAQIRPFIGKLLSRLAFEAIVYFTNAFYEFNASLLERRVAEERIRDCHGDLHLEHIHLTRDSVDIFDCIEFNDRFRSIDVANDLAFLAMDLDAHGRPDLGAAFLNKAAAALDDPDLLKLANFYKCYRACVRGKVEALQAGRCDAAESEVHKAAARRYFQGALRYAVAGSQPLLLVVMGRVGTGKSTVANLAGRELGWPVFSSDQLRKSMADLPLSERTPAQLRPSLYSQEMTERTYSLLLEKGLSSALANQGAVIDATFSNPAHREFLRAQAELRHLPFYLVEMTAEDGVIRGRLKERDRSSSEISDARLEDFKLLSRQYSPVKGLDPRVLRIRADQAAAHTAKNLLRQLAEKQVLAPAMQTSALAGITAFNFPSLLSTRVDAATTHYRTSKPMN